MRIGEGAEWALHTCLVLAWLDGSSPVPVTRLAAAHELPSAYLNKHLQALVRAGVVTSTPGRRGGFRLAGPPERITVLDVVLAIEGGESAFRCTEIRQRGVGAQIPSDNFRNACGIASVMWQAEKAWRQTLARTTIADLMATTEAELPGSAGGVCRWYARTPR